MAKTVEITVAVCTYNRADLLDGVLVSLCTQAVPASCFEILVIDNASTDNTADCVQTCQQRYPNHSIRMIYEGRQGLGLARTTAMQQAKGCYIAYLDDDARAEPDWLAQALVILRERTEELVCLGGPILPFYTTPKPVWFKDDYESRSWGSQARQLKSGESFSGSNMIWRKSILQAIGGFTDRLGVKGESLSVGEETDAFRQVWWQYEDPLLYYAPILRVLHWVPPFKMKVYYRLRRAFVTGQVAVQLRRQTGWRWRVRAVLGGTRDLLYYSLWAVRQIKQYDYWQNWLVEIGETAMNKLGVVLASMGIYIQVKQK